MTARGDEAASRAKPLTSPSAVTALLRRHGITPDKAFGQNFLVDARALAAILEAADVTPRDTAFEVGPGLGALTVELAARARKVVTVELDRRLMPALEETLAGLDNVELIQGDAVRFDLARLPRAGLLVANLPYNAATAVLMRALESGRFTRLVFLVQREVAERLTAVPMTPAFGALTLLVAHFGRAGILRRLPPGAFYPPPKVESSLVRIDAFPDARPDPELFRLIHDAFAHRRKTLVKNLVMAGRAREDVERALAGLGLSARARAEELDLSAFRRLAAGLVAREARR